MEIWYVYVVSYSECATWCDRYYIGLGVQAQALVVNF